MKRIEILSITLLALIPAFCIRAQGYEPATIQPTYASIQTRKPEVWHREWGFYHFKAGELRNGNVWSIEFVQPIIGEDIKATLARVQPGDQITGRAVASDGKKKLDIIGVATGDTGQPQSPEKGAQYLGSIQNPNQPGNFLAIFKRESAREATQRLAREARQAGQQAYTSAQQFGREAYTSAAAGLGSVAGTLTAPIASAFRPQPGPTVWYRELGLKYVRIGQVQADGKTWVLEFAEPLVGKDIGTILAEIQPGDEVTGSAITPDRMQKLSIIAVAVPAGGDASKTPVPEKGARYLGQITNPNQRDSSLAIFGRESTVEAVRRWAKAEQAGQQAFTTAMGQTSSATAEPGVSPASQRPVSQNAPVHTGP